MKKDEKVKIKWFSKKQMRSFFFPVNEMKSDLRKQHYITLAPTVFEFSFRSWLTSKNLYV